MSVSATQLRGDIYRLLDHVIDSGEALEVERRGVVLRIVPRDPKPATELFPPREGLICCEPDDLVHTDWSHTWTGAEP